jgi:hypothetical protein
MTARKAPAPANLAQARKAQAASKAAHPAGKQAPKPAAKSAPAKVEAQKVTYSATARSGKTNTRVSTTPLSHAVDVKISGRKSPQFAAGVIVAFYSSKQAAEKVVEEINGGNVADFSDARVVAVKVVTEAVSA